MSIVEHLYELRTRILWSLLAIVLAAVVGFFWYNHSMLGLRPSGELLRGPYCELPESARAEITRTGADAGAPRQRIRAPTPDQLSTFQHQQA